MAKRIKKGFYWHVHHKTLIEHCYDYDGRVAHIEMYKPKSERPLRLRLLKRVKGKLPAALVRMRAAYDKARAAYDAEAAYDKAWTASDKAWAAYRKALRDNKVAIEKLHAKECPNCPWDGKTIFPNKKT